MIAWASEAWGLVSKGGTYMEGEGNPKEIDGQAVRTQESRLAKRRGRKASCAVRRRAILVGISDA
jgi:hypothetical protein